MTNMIKTELKVVESDESLQKTQAELQKAKATIEDTQDNEKIKKLLREGSVSNDRESFRESGEEV